MTEGQQTMANKTERKFITYIFQEKGPATPCRAIREASGFGQEEEAGTKRKPFIGGSAARARQSRVNSSAVASLYVSGLWAVGVVFHCLIPGAGPGPGEILAWCVRV